MPPVFLLRMKPFRELMSPRKTITRMHVVRIVTEKSEEAFSSAVPGWNRLNSSFSLQPRLPCRTVAGGGSACRD